MYLFYRSRNICNFKFRFINTNIFNVNKFRVKDVFSFNLKLVVNIWEIFLMLWNLFFIEVDRLSFF